MACSFDYRNTHSVWSVAYENDSKNYYPVKPAGLVWRPAALLLHSLSGLLQHGEGSSGIARLSL